MEMTLSREPMSRPTVGFIEQQQAGLMQHGAGDLDAACLSARKIAHLLVARDRRDQPSVRASRARTLASRRLMPCKAAW